MSGRASGRVTPASAATSQIADAELVDATESRALVPAGDSAVASPAGGRAGMRMIVPLADPETARAAVQAFEQLKSAIALPGDFVRDRQGRTYYKRKFWRRVALAFGLSLELVREQREVTPAGVVRYSVVYRATAPNGQGMDGDGYCDSAEFGPTEHNTRAKAHTRAKNRAIADLVGGGEVSADEMPVPSRRRQQSQPQPQPHAANGAANGAKPPSWSSLRLRGLELSYETQAEWEEFVIAVTGKTDPHAYTADDARKVAAALDAQAAAEATGQSGEPGDEWMVDEVPGELLDEEGEEEGASPDEPDDPKEAVEHDLRGLGPGKGRH